MKRLRNVFALVLMLMMVCGTMNLTTFADTGSENDVYNWDWTYNNADHNSCYWSDTPHKVKNENGEVHACVIFRLTDTTDADAEAQAYCCDAETAIASVTKYKRINLEDSTYYDETAAGKIRAIFEHGYWPTMSMNDVKAAADDANA